MTGNGDLDTAIYRAAVELERKAVGGDREAVADLREARKSNGQRLKSILASKGLGARAIQRKWGTDLATINRWFSGDIPIPSAIWRLADLEPSMPFGADSEPE